MGASWYASPGVASYGTASLAFAWLTIQLAMRWQSGGKPAMLLATGFTGAVSAAATFAFLLYPSLAAGWVAAYLEFVRVAVSLGFLLAFLGVRRGKRQAKHESRGWAPLIGAGVLLLALWFLFGVRPPGLVYLDPAYRQLTYASALAVCVYGLVLVEQCYRRTPPPSRWNVRPLLLGFAGLFAFDVAVYSDALLFRTIDLELWFARGFAQALTVPLVLMTLRRRTDWSFDLSVSRGVVVGSTALMLTGAYLLVVAGTGFLIRQFGGAWGRALESILIFGALLLLAALLLSATLRAKVRVLVAKHFFTYRYDYREEWLKLTTALTSRAVERPWSVCVEALGALVESPGGALWLRSLAGMYRQVHRANFPASTDTFDDGDSLPTFLREKGWIVEVNDVRHRPADYSNLLLPPALAGNPDAWVIVPLLTGSELVGFVVLSPPRVKIDLDWEVLDLLKTAGRQAAGYLAYAAATESLLEAQKFEAFHRMSTFVVHDLKNLIAQLQLLLSNAERHRDNPDFQRDMLRTVEHVASRMHQLSLQLRPEASAQDRPRAVDVPAVVRRIQSLRLGNRDGLTVTSAVSPALAWAHEDLLERVIAHLVQNAFDASEGVPDVRVHIEPSGGEVRIEVSDRGRGMTAEFMRERLYRPFQTTKATGMGIGVFECRQYLQQIGGRIEFESVVGKGTRVRVWLPGVAPNPAVLGEAA